MPWADTKEKWSQREQRRQVRYKDQQGRPYHASIEIKSGAPCGVIEAGYTCPLPVPSKYIEPSKDPERPYDVFVNYDRWLADVRVELQEREKLGRMLTRRQYPEWNVREKGLPRDILEALGPSPQAEEPIIAARQGNLWILGKTKVPDKNLIKFFEPEQLDPEYQRRHEPDFSYVPINGEEEAEEEHALDRLLRIEEESDPNATGGKIEPVRRGQSQSPSAVRKRTARAQKKQQEPAPETTDDELDDALEHATA